MSYPGLFISLEGGDGVGKSTQAGLLSHWLTEQFGAKVVVTREPGGTDLGLTLRQLIQHGEELDARTEALLFAADRAHHVNTLIRPALERGAIVLCDRYLDSSVAYQSAGRQLPAAQIEQLSLWATAGLLPDVTVLFDLAPETALARQTEAPDRIEQTGLEFHQRVRDGYLARAKAEPNRWVQVSADGTPAEVFAATQAALNTKVRAWSAARGNR